MSQIPTENDDDNRSVAASDFVQLDQADEVPDHQEEQQQGQSQFGLHPSLDWTLETGSTHNNYENAFKEIKWMIANLQANIQTLQANVKNLELEAEIRALKENAEQKALEAKINEVAQMLSTQNEQRQMEELEAKNLKLEKKLMNNVELQTTKNGALEAKMEQLQDEFSKMLAEQQKQAQFHSLEQKLKESEQRAQIGKNELEEIVEENQKKLEKFRLEMDKNGQQAIGSNLSKLDYMWDQLMSKSQILANPKGMIWDVSKTEAQILECGLKLRATLFERGFAIATEGCAISGEHYRKDNFQCPETSVFYYEVALTSMDAYTSIGFTDGSKPPSDHVGGSPNSYGIAGYNYDTNTNKVSLWLSGKKHKLECQSGVIARGNVVGAGLLVNSKNELAVFFTRNGNLFGKQIRINPTVDRLYPTVYISFNCIHMKANFGDNLVAKPFKFDTGKCPGLVFE